MEATDEVDLGFFDQVPDMRLLQVLNLIVIGSSKVSAQTTIVARDYDTTNTRWLFLVDAIFCVNTSLFANVPEQLAILVFADAADVGNRVGWKDILDYRRKRIYQNTLDQRHYSAVSYLSTTSCVLRRTTSNADCLGVLSKVFKQTHVLLLGKDCVIGLQAIFLKKGVITGWFFFFFFFRLMMIMSKR